MGFGILAALAHMSGQFWTAYALFIPNPALLHLYPALMALAVVLGMVSGLLTRSVLTRLNTPLTPNH